jgi:hypothetical protein
MAEYFDLDPALVRLLWVAAAVVTGGLVVPIYILAWIVIPRDDRAPAPGGTAWRDWSAEFHSETQRLASEARRMADDVREPWQAGADAQPSTGPDASPNSDPARSAASDKGRPVAAGGPPAEPDPWWTADRYNAYVDNHPRSRGGRHPRSTGIVLVGLGVLLLAANAGVFNWIAWQTMWPVIFIGLGLILLARHSGWNR